MTVCNLKPMFMVAWVISVVVLVATGLGMPEMVGIKFDPQGVATGVLPKWAYMVSTSISLFLLPAIVALVPASLVLSGSRWAWVPHKEYWLTPERRAEAGATLAGQMQELACMLMAFQLFHHWMVVEAVNKGARLDVQTDNLASYALAGGVGLWVLMRYWLWTPEAQVQQEA